MPRPQPQPISRAAALARLITEVKVDPGQADAVNRILVDLAPDFVGMRELCRRLSCGRDTVRRLYRAGRIPALSVGTGQSNKTMVFHLPSVVAALELPHGMSTSSARAGSAAN